jgi:hypothetical protein
MRFTRSLPTQPVAPATQTLIAMQEFYFTMVALWQIQPTGVFNSLWQMAFWPQTHPQANEEFLSERSVIRTRSHCEGLITPLVA